MFFAFHLTAKGRGSKRVVDSPQDAWDNLFASGARDCAAEWLKPPRRGNGEMYLSQAAGFAELDLSTEVLKALELMGFTEATSVQKQTIPVMMRGADVVAIAPTGTGKTTAYGIPMLEYISLSDKRIQEVVLSPTRELAMQITAELTMLAKYIPQVRIATLYGGQPISRQITSLRKAPQIVVATPGRLLDLMQRRVVDLSFVHTMVIDEADEMFKMGFVKDVTKIIEATSPSRQLVMFSATSNQDLMTVSWRYQTEPVEITVEAVKEDRPQIAQYTMLLDGMDKIDCLEYLLDSDEYNRIMVFSNTKHMTQRISDKLRKQGYRAEALHGDMRQSQRTAVMNDYKRGKFPILVATDVAARGIDVFDVEAVVNFDLPNENEYYLHRIGRTGRARRHGVSFTMMSYRESVRMEEILRHIKSSPTPLHFDSDGILRYEDGKAFFKHI